MTSLDICLKEPAGQEPSSMNTKFLISASFLLALLGHLFIFNFFTFMFSIDPVDPKPKFFFLGPVLQQSDLNLGSTQSGVSKKDPDPLRTSAQEETVLKNIHYEIADPDKKPFIIKTIRKPLVSQTEHDQEKIVLKSTFELPSERGSSKETPSEKPDAHLDIQPYQPLQLQIP